MMYKLCLIRAVKHHYMLRITKMEKSTNIIGQQGHKATVTFMCFQGEYKMGQTLQEAFGTFQKG